MGNLGLLNSVDNEPAAFAFSNPHAQDAELERKDLMYDPTVRLSFAPKRTDRVKTVTRHGAIDMALMLQVRGVAPESVMSVRNRTRSEIRGGS